MFAWKIELPFDGTFENVPCSLTTFFLVVAAFFVRAVSWLVHVFFSAKISFQKIVLEIATTENGPDEVVAGA